MSARAPRSLMIEAEAGLSGALRAHPTLEGPTFEAANGEADPWRRLRRRAYEPNYSEHGNEVVLIKYLP